MRHFIGQSDILRGEVIPTAHESNHNLNHKVESAHGHAHEHEHMHAHTHKHDSDHTHSQLHHHHPEAGAGQSHGSGCKENDEKEVYALVKYMLSHNKHHAGELCELGARLNALGKSEAAALVAAAASWYEKGNLELEKAVGLLD